MKTTTVATEHSVKSAGSKADQPHFQIYRQGQAGNYHPEFSTDSAEEVVAFIESARVG